MCWSNDFKENCIMRMQENLPRIIICINQLPETVIWQKPVAAGNAMGNLILHLCGNITQYIISGIGGEPDNRVRDNEFNATGGFGKAGLLQMLTETIQKATNIIAAATETDLLKIRMVQGFQLSGLGIIIHVTEHLSYHTGQIALFTKMHNNNDLGFYKDLDLNVKNEEL
jgi:uncharacterized damage-inducible protein DinB